MDHRENDHPAIIDVIKNDMTLMFVPAQATGDGIDRPSHLRMVCEQLETLLEIILVVPCLMRPKCSRP